VLYGGTDGRVNGMVDGKVNGGIVGRIDRRKEGGTIPTEEPGIL
jgi:hypothetical protein